VTIRGDKTGAPLCWAEIDFDRLHHNLDLMGKTSSRPMAPVIKANAYGHGMIAIAREIAPRPDVAALSVFSLAEAAELRRAKVSGRIIVMGGVTPEETSAALQLKIEPVVSDYATAKRLNDTAGRVGVGLHLKINTGMNRLGCPAEEGLKLYRKIVKLPKIRIVGLMTHFADAEKRGGLTKQQTALFNEVTNAMDNAIPRHAANTAALFLHPDARYDLVRPGIGMYGVQTFGGKDVGLKSILTLKARVIALREIEKGTSVSYGMKWKSGRRGKVALCAIGYADGFPRALSNVAHAMMGRLALRQVGTICMDDCLFDVTGTKVRTGSIFTLIGDGKRVRAKEIAKRAATIPYEILCGVGRRVERRYLSGGKIIHHVDYLNQR